MEKSKRKILTISKVNTKQLHGIKESLGCVSDSETIRTLIREKAEAILHD